jgi:hypothetical protein
MAGLGAFAVEDPDYRGEAYVAERGGATAVVSSWSPNAVEVRVDGADPGDHVVLNQNYDPGWRADGQPAVPYRDAVAAVATARSQTVRFAYAPRSAWIGLGAFVVTLVIIGVALKRAGTGRQGHAA